MTGIVQLFSYVQKLSKLTNTPTWSVIMETCPRFTFAGCFLLKILQITYKKKAVQKGNNTSLSFNKNFVTQATSQILEEFFKLK